LRFRCNFVRLEGDLQLLNVPQTCASHSPSYRAHPRLYLGCRSWVENACRLLLLPAESAVSKTSQRARARVLLRKNKSTANRSKRRKGQLLAAASCAVAIEKLAAREPTFVKAKITVPRRCNRWRGANGHEGSPGRSLGFPRRAESASPRFRQRAAKNALIAQCHNFPNHGPRQNSYTTLIIAAQ